MPPARPAFCATLVCAFASLAVAGCDTPHAYAVLDNGYAPSAALPLVVYDAFWQAIDFPTPVPPGTSSAPVSTVAASANTAYVLLAPGWDPASSMAPTKYVLLESRDGFGVHLEETLHILVDDTHFVGNCAAGSHLSEDQALFMAEGVFRSEFGSLGYDVATCTVTGRE
jgi:hypothetical protein